MVSYKALNTIQGFTLMSSNRTFMELKLQKLSRYVSKDSVLIVPLWN